MSVQERGLVKKHSDKLKTITFIEDNIEERNLGDLGFGDVLRYSTKSTILRSWTYKKNL